MATMKKRLFLGIFATRASSSQSLSAYWMTRNITRLSVVSTSDTTQTVTATYTGTGQDGVKFECTSDFGATWVSKGSASDGVLNATGLTENTYYQWRARLYKGSNNGDYYDETIGASTYNIETQNLINRKIAAGETVTTREKEALHKAISSLIQVGAFSTQFDVLVVPRGNLSPSHLFNWIKDANNGSNLGTTAFVQNEGNKKNEANSYINTNFNLSSSGVLYTLNDACFIRKLKLTATGTVGALDVSANGMCMGAADRINSSNTLTGIATTLNNYAALCRDSASSVRRLKYGASGSTEETQNNNATSVPNLNVYLHRLNYSSALDDGVNQTVEFYGFGKGSTLTQAKFDWVQIIMNQYFEDIDNIVTATTYYLDTKTLFIPAKGVANILSVKDNWVLAYFTGEDTLYLSRNNGKTWEYSAAFTGCANIKMAAVFSSGAVLLAKRDNTVWSSQDFLANINAVTVKNMNGSDFVFHTPENASYPGEYFNVYSPRTFNIGSKEVLLWGLYDSYATETERNGAAPANVYYTADDGVTVKCCYKWGTGRFQADKGTWDSDGSGTHLGDDSNVEVIDHCHVVCQNPFDESLYFLSGDSYPYVHFAKFVYNVTSDTWTVTTNKCPNEAQFRATGMAFYQDSGTTKIKWASDNSGNIYETTEANIIGAIATQDLLFDGDVDLLGITDYAQVMFATGYNSTRYLAVSMDYGATWEVISAANKLKLKAGQLDGVDYGCMKILNSPNEYGYWLIQRTLSAAAGAFNATKTFLLKVVKL